MNDDPISQLPEPYRVAWEILHEAFDYESILRNVLTSAQKMVGATWGMMILDTDLESLDITFPGFHTLPDIINTTIPVGYVTSLAYALIRKTVQDGQNILITDTNNVVELDVDRLMDEYLPLKKRESIMKHANETWFSSHLLEIPSTSSFTALVLPIIDKDKLVGGMYLHRLVSQGVFSRESLGIVQTFLSCIAIGIRNVRDVENIKGLALQFPYTLSHELRTPLIIIHGYAKLLSENSIAPRNDIDVKKFSNVIMDNADRIRNIMDTLLVYARIERNLVYKQGVNLNDIINPIIEKYRLVIQTKNQTLILDIPNSIDIVVGADEYLAEVVDALMRNAHLYTLEGGEIKISLSFDNNMFHFRVSDNGLGLTEDDKIYLFQRYSRSQRDEIRRIPGIGMGLYIARRLIELWGGEIGAEGSPDQGSTFWFTLPIAKE